MEQTYLNRLKAELANKSEEEKLEMFINQCRVFFEESRMKSYIPLSIFTLACKKELKICKNFTLRKGEGVPFHISVDINNVAKVLGKEEEILWRKERTFDKTIIGSYTPFYTSIIDGNNDVIMRAIFSLYVIVESIEIDYLKKNYRHIFMMILQQTVPLNKLYCGNSHSWEIEMAQLIVTVLKVKNERIYDGRAGCGFMAYYLPEGCHYTCLTTNPLYRDILLEIVDNFKCASLLTTCRIENIDCFICNPYADAIKSTNEIREEHETFYRECLPRLSNKAKVALVLSDKDEVQEWANTSQNVCFKNNWVGLIVFLPEDFRLVLLDKSRNKEDRIKIVDATNVSFTADNVLNRINDSTMVSTITQNEALKGEITLNSIIRKKQVMITAKGNISLNKILTHVCPSKKNVNEKNFHLPFLDSKLKENYSPFRAIITAKNEMFNMISEKESNSLLLKEKLLILNPLNYSLYQPLIFIPKDGLAVCSDNLVCFRIDESMVDVEYLVNELNKEYFKKQLFPRIDVCKQQWVVEEFLSLYIQIPDCETSVERQRLLYHEEKLKYLKSINQSYGYDVDAIATNKATNLPEGTLLYNGKYKVLKSLRSGGFGKTYKAIGYFQIGGKTIKSEVAIKEFFMSSIQKRDVETLKVVTPLEKLDEVSSSRKKFMVEAEKIKQYSDHPHIVDVYDVFDENETCYYTMEYIEGGSLMDYVEQTETFTLQEEEALKIIREVASALSAMHRHRMNHLDVKPENILMSEEGKAVLIDFGAAHKFSIDDEASSILAITSGGFSPLEIGKINDFSPATDIYSLGATLYWLLTGEEPPREGLSERDEKPECISDKVWKVLSLSLQTFRENRPQSIEEFLALLN